MADVGNYTLTVDEEEDEGHFIVNVGEEEREEIQRRMDLECSWKSLKDHKSLH